MQAAYIAVFGIAGVLSRYYVGTWINRLVPGQFPAGTFTINMLGCFLIGLVYALGNQRGFMSETLRVAIIVGFLGGFTTFSAFGLEARQLLASGYVSQGIGYIVLSPLLGVLSVYVGIWLVRVLVA